MEVALVYTVQISQCTWIQRQPMHMVSKVVNKLCAKILASGFYKIVNICQKLHICWQGEIYIKSLYDLLRKAIKI